MLGTAKLLEMARSDREVFRAAFCDESTESGNLLISQSMNPVPKRQSLRSNLPNPATHVSYF